MFGLLIGSVKAQQPSINSLTDSAPGLSQDLIQVGSGQFILTVRGSGFSSTSTIRFGLINLATTLIDVNTLSGTIPPSLIKSIGTVSLTVVDGNASSNSLNLQLVVRGDANGSGTVNIGDALVLARSAGGLIKPAITAGAGDLNLSDALNIGDALVLALFAGGISPNLTTPVISSTSVIGAANMGDSISITGTGFSSNAADNLVFFSQSDGTFVQAPATAVSSGSGTKILTVAVPTGAVSGPIFVKRRDLGLPGQPFGLSITGAASPVYITKVSPVTGLVAGSNLIILGTGFSPTIGDDAVVFSQAGTATLTAIPSVATNTSLTVAVPNGAASGYVYVTVGSNASNRKSILISGTGTPLLINNVYYSDLPGEPVLIEGTGFNASTPADNQVLFTTSTNTQVAGTVVMVGKTELIALVPSGTITGSLTVKTNSGSNVSNDFNFRAAGALVGAPSSSRIEFAYDALNRLTEVRYPYTVIKYTYDLAGNRLTMDVSPRSP